MWEDPEKKDADEQEKTEKSPANWVISGCYDALQITLLCDPDWGFAIVEMRFENIK